MMLRLAPFICLPRPITLSRGRFGVEGARGNCKFESIAGLTAMGRKQELEITLEPSTHISVTYDCI